MYYSYRWAAPICDRIRRIIFQTWDLDDILTLKTTRKRIPSLTWDEFIYAFSTYEPMTKNMLTRTKVISISLFKKSLFRTRHTVKTIMFYNMFLKFQWGNAPDNGAYLVKYTTNWKFKQVIKRFLEKYFKKIR